RSHGERPRRPLPDPARRHRVAGRSADARCARGRDLLPRRGCRGAAGHHRRAAFADRSSAHAVDRQDRRANPRRARLPARDLVQPGLSAPAQGSEAEHAAALRRPRARLPARRAGGGDRRARERRRSRDGTRDRHARRAHPRAARPRAGGGAEHAAARRGRRARHARRADPRRVPRGDRRAADGRRSARRRAARSHRRDVRLTPPRAAMSEPEELISDAARHATVFVRDVWRRHLKRGRGERRLGLPDVAPRLDLLLTAVFTEGRRIRVAQLPPPSTLLRQVFGADRGPRQKHAVPATDGASIWLPSTLGLDDDALAMLCYRTMALAQAARARRGSAAPAAGLRPGLVADVYLLLEAHAADQMLAALLPGLAAPIDTLRRTALERRPPVDAFPPRRRPIERLARELLGSRCGRPLDAALVPSAPSGSLALAKRIAAELAAAAGTDRSRAEPLLKDWWTGALRTPSISDEPVKLPGESSEPDDVDRAPSAARLRRSPARREAIDGEDDEDDAGLVAVQQDDPHPHAEDPMGLRRPVDRDEDASAEQL